MEEKNYILELCQGRCDDPRARIIKAALEEFGLYSFLGARTREIAAKAGVNHAAISYYFGGKTELYTEVATQICDFININNRPYSQKLEELKKSPAPKEARKLLVELISKRMASESVPDYLLRSMILIISREELYQTKVFDIFLEVFRKDIALVAELISMASSGQLSGNRATLLARMFIGQAHIFSSSRSSLQKILGTDKHSEEVVEHSSALVLELTDKFIM